MNKKTSRLRRARKTRAQIHRKGVNRLSIHRTPRHIYAQVIDPSGESVLVAASTLQKSVVEGVGGTGNTDAAKAVGKAIADKALAAGIESVAFDRSGFKYHGRVQALADAAREAGLKF